MGVAQEKYQELKKREEKNINFNAFLLHPYRYIHGPLIIIDKFELVNDKVS